MTRPPGPSRPPGTPPSPDQVRGAAINYLTSWAALLVVCYRAGVEIPRPVAISMVRADRWARTLARNTQPPDPSDRRTR
jgi:hypothetical protein